jgi:hypothetical protein
MGIISFIILSRTLFFTIIINFICPITAITQVIIREKITLNSKHQLVNSGSRILAASFNRPEGIATINPCGGSNAYSNLTISNSFCNGLGGSYANQVIGQSGSASVNLSPISAYYKILAGYYYTNNGTATVNVTLDGMDIGSKSNPTIYYGACLGYDPLEVDVQVFSDFSWSSANPMLSHGGQSGFNIGTAGNQCESPIWSPVVDLINLEVQPSNKPLGHLFQGTQGTPMTTLTGIHYSDMGEIDFIADGRQPKMAVEPVSIIATIGAAGLSHQTTINVQCSLNPTSYRQNEGSYKGDTLDHSGTIAGWGCALVSLTNAMNAFGIAIQPGALNSWLKDPQNKGFVDRKINWQAMVGYISTVGSVHATKMPSSGIAQSHGGTTGYTSNSVLQSPLTDLCELAIVQVYNPGSRHKDKEHWVLVTGRQANGGYTIIDPQSPDNTTLDAYGNKFWGYVLIGAK